MSYALKWLRLLGIVALLTLTFRGVALAGSGILERYPELRGSRYVKITENRIADGEHLERIKDRARLAELVHARTLVTVPMQGVGFFLDKRLPEWRHYLRPEALLSLKVLSLVYWMAFHAPLKVSSLVRPRDVQEEIARSNPNALSERKGDPPSLHLTGCAFDISAKDMTGAERMWLAGYLANMSWLSAKIWPTYEYRKELNFHIVIFP